MILTMVEGLRIFHSFKPMSFIKAVLAGGSAPAPASQPMKI